MQDRAFRDDRESEQESVPVAAPRVTLAEADASEVSRVVSGPWDHCFGGGLVRTTSLLLAGKPGGGKSTFLLQLADALIPQLRDDESIAFILAEETAAQCKQRADRLGIRHQSRIIVEDVRGTSSDIGEILARAGCQWVFLDSLPGLVGPGNHGGSLAACKAVKDYVADSGGCAVLVDHVTKDDDFAGLRALEHEVDGTFTLFPDASGVRRLHTEKCRTGPAFVFVDFAMGPSGLIPLGYGTTGEEPIPFGDDDQ